MVNRNKKLKKKQKRIKKQVKEKIKKTKRKNKVNEMKKKKLKKKEKRKTNVSMAEKCNRPRNAIVVIGYLVLTIPIVCLCE